MKRNTFSDKVKDFPQLDPTQPSPECFVSLYSANVPFSQMDHTTRQIDDVVYSTLLGCIRYILDNDKSFAGARCPDNRILDLKSDIVLLCEVQMKAKNNDIYEIKLNHDKLNKVVFINVMKFKNDYYVEHVMFEDFKPVEVTDIIMALKEIVRCFEWLKNITKE
jgi:hypothetical protein